MTQKKTIQRYTVYTVAICLIFLLSVLLLFSSVKSHATRTQPSQKETVYVYVTEASTDARETDVDTESPIWILREHEGQIGVFDKNGILQYLLDTYTKTLPKADRDLLREGIMAETEERLRALIEDYTE